MNMKINISKFLAFFSFMLFSINVANAGVTNIIPFGPGGESDVTARMQQPFYKNIYKDDMTVQYKPGGGGSVGWSSLNDEKSDGSVIYGCKPSTYHYAANR